MNKIEQLHEFLTEHGFKFGTVPSREMNNVNWYAWRASKLPARECECNEGKPAQLVVYPYSFNLHEKNRTSVEVEICDEAGEIWYKLQAYSITADEFMARMDEIEASLINAWNAL